MNNENMDIVVHIGYPKAGSTTLQTGLFSNLHHEGSHHFLRLSENGHSFQDMCTAVVSRYHPFEKTLPLWRQKLFAEMRSHPDVISILSDECLCHSQHLFSFDRDWRVSAERLGHLLEGLNARILIVIRNQISAIYSHYVQNNNNYIPYAHQDTYEKFVDYQLSRPYDGILDMYDYHRVIARYEALFGREQVYPVLFEEMVRQGPSLETLARALDTPVNRVKRNMAGTHANNTQKTTEGYWTKPRKVTRHLGDRLIARGLKHEWIDSLFVQVYSGNRICKSILAKTVIQLIRYSRAIEPKLVPFPERKKNADLAKVFKGSNEQLQRAYGFDLKKYGYPLP